MTPEVSVLLPCYNAAATVTAAVQSILVQDVDLEVIAVDDGSTDATVDRIAELGDPRVKLVRSAHAGIIASLTIGVQHATGAVLARMDADDVTGTDRLVRQLACLHANREIVACGTPVRYVPRETVRDGARRYETWINSLTDEALVERNMFVECPIAHPTLTMRRSAYDGVGGYRDTAWAEDYDLVLRLWRAGGRFTNVATMPHQWRDDEHRLSRTDRRYAPDMFLRCKVEYLRHRTGRRPLIVWGAGPIGKTFARATMEHGYEVVAFVDIAPRKVGNHVGRVPILAPAALSEHTDAFVVVAVGTPGAREQIADHLASTGRRHPDDWCAVA